MGRACSLHVETSVTEMDNVYSRAGDARSLSRMICMKAERASTVTAVAMPSRLAALDWNSVMGIASRARTRALGG